MKHANGVDISAWARSDKGQKVKAEELEVSVDGNHHDCYRRFYMPFCDGDVQFRFRLPFRFDAHGASTIHARVFTYQQDGVQMPFKVCHTLEWRANNTRTLAELRLPAPVEAASQGYDGANGAVQPLPPGLNGINVNALLASSEYDVPTVRGVVRAFFQLEDSRWLDRRFSKTDKDFVPWTFKRREGTYGDMYIWDIVPVSDELFEQLRTPKQGSGHISRALSGTQVLPDQTTGPSNPEPAVLPRQSTSDVGLTTPSPSVNNEAFFVVAKARPSMKRLIPTKKKSPKVCGCGDPEHQPVGRKRNERDDLHESSPSPRQRRKRNDNGRASTTRKERPLSHEMVASVCGQRQHLKKALRGKKIAWRNHSETWMIVDVRAHDEEPPTEEIIEEQQMSDDGSATSPTQANDHGGNHSPGHDANSINAPRGSFLANSGTSSEPTANPVHERSAISCLNRDIGNPVSEEHTPPQLQMAEVPSNTTTVSIQDDTLARPSVDQTPPTASALAAFTGFPSNGRASSRQRSGRRESSTVVSLTEGDDNAFIKNEVKPGFKLESEEPKPNVSHAIRSDRTGNKDEAALLEKLQDIEMNKARIRLEKQELVLEQERVLLERQLKKKKHGSGTLEKPIKIEDH